MRVDYPEAKPDNLKLMGAFIERTKNTKDRVLRSTLAFININGQVICVSEGHPKFVLSKTEETARMLTKENTIIPMELNKEKFTENKRRLAQELEEELEAKLAEEADPKKKKQPRTKQRAHRGKNFC